MDRRELILSGLAAPFVWTSGSKAQAPVHLSDMHFHSFFGPSKYHSRPVGAALASGGLTLVAWSLVGDLLWFDTKRFRHRDTPKPGEALGWFERELARIKAHLAEQSIKYVRAPEDVDRALQGEPHVVLAVEGATFLDNDPGSVQRAYDLGLRHLQIVHYALSALGDIQTEPPLHNGLTPAGRHVVAECNRLGMLIDVAHCTPAAVRDALALSKAPVVCSHGSVTRGPAPHPGLITWRARQLPLEAARSIAQKGGVVGLWALKLDIGDSPEAYGARLLELAGWIGEEHVAFGTDINGLGPNAMLHDYAGLRRVVHSWQAKGVPERRIRRMASENYARVLKQAMQARTA